jgi:lon-related putative ATP-dependent protease
MPLTPLPPEALYRACDTSTFTFSTTAEVPPLEERLGQTRAMDALSFGVAMRHAGYNVFAMGPQEAGKATAVKDALAERAAKEPVPDDVVYVANFARPHEPRALYLPAGRARALAKDVDQLLEELRQAIPAALEGDEFGARKNAIEEEVKERQEKTFGELAHRAKERNIALLHTPMGFALAPVKNGEVVEPAEFQKLPEEERKRFAKEIEELGTELQQKLADVPRWAQDVRKRIRELIRDTLRHAVGHLIDDLKKRYEALPAVTAHLDALAEDVLDNVGAFLKGDDQPHAPEGPGELADAQFRRYRVNVLVDHAETKGSPVVYEDHPTYDNLVGRIEHVSHMGSLVTDFNLIKAGALHRANGGYLVMDARHLLVQPYAWEALKRALDGRQIRMEPLGRALGLVSTVSVEPEPVPLHLKVVLVGDRRLYYLLDSLDPEFREHFKVVADFEDVVPRSDDIVRCFAQLISRLAKEDSLLPFGRDGVARVVERCSRLAEDAEKLIAHVGLVRELVMEAEHQARARGAQVVTAEDVDTAVAGAERREGRVRERVQEEILRGTFKVETSGAKVGQVNGLSVMMLGRAPFGRPSRITARARLGKGEVIDLEREVELGGPLHSKGVLTLSGFLAARYAPEHPLSLSATLTFEQSYGPVDGDSASSAELYALLSALSDVPLRQCFAVTGSVDQHGDVQAIGGVNEKIEGFFDVCAARGLGGEHGVLVPRTNVKHLMLRKDVVDAVRAGKFRIFAVSTIDEGIEILTGVPAGARGADGKFPEGTINRKVEDRLVALASIRESFGEPKRKLDGQGGVAAAAPQAGEGS